MRPEGAADPPAIAELVDAGSRGARRMALLEQSAAYIADREWLARHIAMRKLRLAAHIEAGWHAAVEADGAIAYFESRWCAERQLDLPSDDNYIAPSSRA